MAKLKKVKVEVVDPKGHTHIDHVVEKGEILEVWPRQAAFLQKRGITKPYKQSKSRKPKAPEAVEAPVEESASESTEGADETPDTQ